MDSVLYILVISTWVSLTEMHIFKDISIDIFYKHVSLSVDRQKVKNKDILKIIKLL